MTPRWLALIIVGANCAPAPTASAPEASGPCAGGTHVDGTLEIHHLAVGQADATLLVSPDGRSLLVDAGEETWDSGDNAHKVATYVFRVLGCRHLDTVALTHFHYDHAGFVGKGGLWALVAKEGFSVSRTLYRDARAFGGRTSDTASTWLAFLEGEGAAALHPEVAHAGSTVDVGARVSVRVIAIDGAGALMRGQFAADPQPPDEDDYSMALRLRFGRFDYYVGGDLSGEFALGSDYAYHDVEHVVAPLLGDTDVVRVNHHGSAHASSKAFVAQTQARVAVISVGDGNPYGHPAQVAVNRWVSAGAKLYLTAHGNPNTDVGEARVGGPVVIRTRDGSAYTVNGDAFTATDPDRADADRDGWLSGADPNDSAFDVQPAPNGGCDPAYQACADASMTSARLPP